MIVPGSVNPLLLATGGYDVPYSLRFRRSNSAYLSRTMGTPTNNKICTWSFWAKRGTLGTTAGEVLFYSPTAAGGTVTILFDVTSPNALRMYGAGGSFNVTSASVYRDTSAWYHFVIVWNSPEATSSNRFKAWVNGESVSFSGTFPPQNQECSWNNSGTSYFGSAGGPFADSRDYIDGYRAECYFIDGQALTPSSFGQTDSATGVWVPKKYSGTYGTNGFYLKFADASAATATAIGKDSSGNGNNWTPSGISVTSGVTFDQMLDTPTLNYCVLNPLSKSVSGGSVKNANMTWNSGGGGATFYLVQSTFVLSGKCYWECVVPATLTYHVPGIMRADQSPPSSGPSYAPGFSLGPTDAVGYRSLDGDVYLNSVVIVSGATPSAGDIIQFAFNAATGELWIGRNGTWLNSGDPAAGTGEVTTVSLSYSWVAVMCDATTQDNEVNFGQRAFSYTPPTGFKALNTANLPTPSIKKGSLYMDATLRTGTGATASVSSLGFQPDLVWIKSRSAATDHGLYDAVRGVQKQLESNTTTGETTETTGLTAFSSNGYTVGALAQLNTSAATYVDWAWKEGVTPGFDIVTYTGNGTNRTISHALGAVPKFMVVKRLDTGNGWVSYHASQNASPATGYMYLNSTAGFAAASTMWNNTAPTSSVFSVGTNSETNGNTFSFVGYLWSEIEGFSRFGSYTGNGSTDGPFVWCGHRPRWLMIKRTDTTNDWEMVDTARGAYNVNTAVLAANSSSAESAFTSGYELDVLSNGFKLRSTGVVHNASGGTYIFAAFAENPFKYARAR